MPTPDRETIHEAVDTAVAETFENLAFMEIRRADADPRPDGGSCRSAWSALKEPWRGTVALACGTDLITEIAETAFGASETTPDAELKTDVLCEMVNIIAGTLLGRLAPADRAVRLAAPRCGGEPDRLFDECFTYELDDGRRIFVGCVFDEPQGDDA